MEVIIKNITCYSIEIITVLYMLAVSLPFMWYIYKRNTACFFFENSPQLRLIKILSIIFFITIISDLTTTLPYLMFGDTVSPIILAIETSFIVSYVFYKATSVHDKYYSDREGLNQLKTIAYCKAVFDGIESEAGKLPCVSNGRIEKYGGKCAHKCSWRKNKQCRYKAQLILYAIFMERKLNTSLLIVSTCKPEIVNPFSVVLKDVQDLKFCLDNGFPVDLSSFNGVTDAHELFIQPEYGGKAKILYADAGYVEECYMKFFQESHKEIEYGAPSKILGL